MSFEEWCEEYGLKYEPFIDANDVKAAWDAALDEAVKVANEHDSGNASAWDCGVNAVVKAIKELKEELK